MTQADTTISMIPRAAATVPLNPLDLIVQNCGRKIASLQMTRLVGEADKGDAQSIVRDLLDFSRIVDAALLDIGRECVAHFGTNVDLTCFVDQLSGAVEGNATHTVCAAIEAREDEIEDEIDPDWRYENARDYAA